MSGQSQKVEVELSEYLETSKKLGKCIGFLRGMSQFPGLGADAKKHIDEFISNVV
jgi:hypothetical protein